MPKIQPVGGGEARIREADLLRGVAILMVAAVHVFGNYSDMTSVNWLMWGAAALKAFSRAAVPLFILLSGFVLSRRYYGEYSAADFYRKRLRVLLGPYIAFSLFYMAAYGALNGWPVPAEILRKLVMASAAEPLWFFRLIFQIYLIYPVLTWVYGRFEKGKSEHFFLAVVLAVQIAATWAGFSPGTPKDAFWADARIFFLTTPQFLFYFILGMWAGRNFEAVKQSLVPHGMLRGIVLAAVVVTLTYVNTVWMLEAGRQQLAAFTEPILFVSTIALFYSILARETAGEGLSVPILGPLGYYAYGIYLVHIFVLALFAKALRHAQITADAALFYPVLLAATVFFSLAAAWLIHRTPASGLLLGMPPFSKNKGGQSVR